MSGDPSFEVERAEKFAVLTLNPENEKLDSILSPAMKSELLVLNKEGFTNLIVDLSNVRYCDSSGLSAILVGSRLSKEGGGTFVIAGVQTMVMKLIEISQLDSILNITPTVSEAKQLVMMEEVERGLE